ncbi:MAG: tRNA (cytidine(56)-2'-O)-methyltransferase [Thaumarchaeota archaeon]|nr:tRNA (cytidine(56)-2'-O)-methyltransferase [Nitrososphaerota archaeon]
MRKVFVLRMGHRLHRDFRITTHCALVARAFGASGIIISGDEDQDIIKSVEKINDSWGGKFEARYDKNWKSLIRNWKKRGYVILTTMYGINLPDAEKIIKKGSAGKDILIVVGSEKMPSEMFHIADLNIAVSNQPHSEVAAIAMILDRVFEGKELRRSFRNAKMKIKPQEKGKRVVPA